MIKSGLVSVSFRNLNPIQIIDQCLRAGIEGIEWGGDAHVPHGDLKSAQQVARRCQDNGLQVASYGSYYRAGQATDPEMPSPEAVVETAAALGAPVIRVWAGSGNHEQLSPAERERVYEDLIHISELAARSGIDVAMEYHVQTLTETMEGADEVLEQITASNFHTFWQPHPLQDNHYRLESLQRVLHRLSHVHVYNWSKDWERYPLADAMEHWEQWLRLANPEGGTRYALLEFFKDDSLEQFYEDAQTLNRMIANLDQSGSMATARDRTR
jgi:sugar phosphate isomerase/epimerase